MQPDGYAKLTVQTATKSIRLSESELAELAREIEKADLSSLPKNSTSEPPVPDAFGYRVIYDGTTVTADGPAMPDKLRGLTSSLGALVERYAK